MKYGTREKIIGAVILIALAIIIVPMIFGSRQKGAQAPQMTINQQPITVPDQNDQGAQSGQTGEQGSTPNNENQPGTGTEGNPANGTNGNNSGTSVSQYNQLLPGSKGPEPVQPQSSNGSTSGSTSGSAQTGENSSQSSQTSVTPAPQQPTVAHETAPAPTRAPASKPAPQHHTAPVKPAPQHPAQASKPAATPSHTTTSSSSSNGMASTDPIMAVANRYHPNQGSSKPSAASSSHTVAATGRWSVQVGSFAQKGNADRLAARLRGMGFHVYQISRGANKVVMVGPYNSSAAGESARQDLQQKANTNGFVVRGTSE